MVWYLRYLGKIYCTGGGGSRAMLPVSSAICEYLHGKRYLTSGSTKYSNNGTVGPRFGLAITALGLGLRH